MSFGARKLRVQLPCGTDGSVIDEGGGEGVDCDWPSVRCEVFTCAWGTECPPFQTQTINCQVGTGPWTGPWTCSWASCQFGMGTCWADTCPNGSCGIPSRYCRFGTTVVPCEGQSRPVEERTVILDAEQLPLLRERLEAQLREIEKAQKALEERRESEK